MRRRARIWRHWRKHVLTRSQFNAKAAILPATDCQAVARIVLILNLNGCLKRLAAPDVLRERSLINVEAALVLR
jgi:hypothetical protein